MYTNPLFYSRLRLLATNVCRRFKCGNGASIVPGPGRVCPFTGADPRKWCVRFSHEDRRNGGGRDRLGNVLITNNSQYLDNLYLSWRRDPSSVPSSWDSYFQILHEETPRQSVAPNDSSRASTIRVESPFPVLPANLAAANQSGPGFPQQSVRSRSDGNTAGGFMNGALDVNATIRAYQARGHLIADTDPLGIQNPDAHKLHGTPNLPPAIVVREHLKWMTDADMDKEYPLAPFTVIGGPKRSLPLRDILIRLNQVYCGHLGLEYTYIHDLVVLDWLRDKFEIPGAWNLPAEHRKFIWLNIMRAVTFEGFLARKFPTEKRFGLEGCEAFVPSMVECLETSAEHGVETAVIGMAHRGRLNTLINVCSKPLHQLLTQFHPIPLEGFGSGDVKYHLGTHMERMLERTNRRILVSVMANPSHLEAIDPVVVGRVRAEQVEKNDAKFGKRSVAILVHGDAAFSGQGIVYETMHLTNLPEYTTGGVIHVVINNQIGFTTDPRYSRSSAHCTDVARVVNAPIFHIHADDPDLVTYCSKVASEYRAAFHNDVVIDVVGYRRFGHNELDEPMLTQPLMYKRIKEHPNVLTVYSEKLLKEGVITEAYAKEEIQRYWDYCESEFEKAKTIDSMQLRDWHDIPWNDFFANQNPRSPIPATGAQSDGQESSADGVETGGLGDGRMPGVSQPAEGGPPRATVRRGRRAWNVLPSRAHYSRSEPGQDVQEYPPRRVPGPGPLHRLQFLPVRVRCLRVIVSPSTGFELGYSAYNHNTLTIWEAQFGDFANTCQVILDSLLCSGQSKWGRQVGLVLLLPHGLEGQGPEHSSARLERFLELCDDDCVHLPGTEPGAPGNETPEQIMTRQLFEVNWSVCNLTTPANLFHALRRQIHMPFRKPLVIMSPKSLLRHPSALSSFKDMETGTTFRPILPDPHVKPGSIQKVLICSGKVFYDLDTERLARQLEDKIAIIRIEQLCPFPYHLLAQEMANYPNAKVMWLQEEHKNQGAYKYARDRIALALGKRLEEIAYGGRSTSAAPATGSKVIHANEYKDMLAAAFKLD